MIHDPRKYKVEIIVENNLPIIDDAKADIKKTIENFGFRVFNVDLIKDYRTLKQNNSLHKFFELLSQELNDKGLDIRATISKDIAIPWTGYNVKNYIWKPLQKKLTGKESTTQLDKYKEINLLWDIINRAFSERFKGEVKIPPFPSLDADENSNFNLKTETSMRK